MKIVEAIRHLSLHYLDSCKGYMDEDNYDDAKLVIENTPDKKLIRKLKKHLDPLGDLLSMENVTSDDLKKAGIISDNSELPSQEDIDTMLSHGKMCYTVLCAVSEMDESTMKQIEELSKVMHENLKETMEGMPENSDASPEDIFKMVAQNMGNITNLDMGSGDNALAGLLQKSIPSLVTTISNANQKNDKKSLLDRFSEIDGKL